MKSFLENTWKHRAHVVMALPAFLILFFGCFIEVAVDMLRGRVADRLLSW